MIKEPAMTVIHEEESFVVVDKVSGLLSVPGRRPEHQDCVTNRVKALYPDCIPHPMVHRLDMDTSGLMVVARTKEAQRHIAKQFEARETKKRYYALLDGHLNLASGTIELPFRLDVDNRPHQIYDDVHGKWGRTIWQNLGIEGPYTRIEFEPITGRTHQLRLHASHAKGLGIPIVGDPLYGNGIGSGNMKLHAATLSFRHPHSEEPLTFESPTPF